jgi:hypothetical protein
MSVPTPCSAFVAGSCRHGHAINPACMGILHYVKPITPPCMDEDRVFDEVRQVVTHARVSRQGGKSNG